MRAQEFITEATYDLDTDVDMIYDMAFAPIILKVRQGTWDGEEFATANWLGTTEILSSPDCKKAHDVNAMVIITTQGNEYNPHGDAIRGPFISISINNQVLELISEHGSIRAALEYIPRTQRERFLTEITPERIKGSIHHALSHWLDDTFHNKHISNRLSWAAHARERQQDYEKADNIMLQGKKEQNLTNYEINAQIHAIKQLKRANTDMWDLYDFDDMIRLNASLTHLGSTFKEMGEYENWKKTLLKRMHREKLLGDEMYRTFK